MTNSNNTNRYGIDHFSDKAAALLLATHPAQSFELKALLRSHELGQRPIYKSCTMNNHYALREAPTIDSALYMHDDPFALDMSKVVVGETRVNAEALMRGNLEQSSGLYDAAFCEYIGVYPNGKLFRFNAKSNAELTPPEFLSHLEYMVERLTKYNRSHQNKVKLVTATYQSAVTKITGIPNQQDTVAATKAEYAA